MPVNAKNLTSAAEAVLFSVGEPLEIGKLAEVLSVDEETCRRTLLNLSASLDERSSGICLLRLGDKYQLSSRTEYADLIRSVLEVKKNAPLSNAAFEVLAVIAYNQPVTKAFVEQVRGVDCSGVISTLCQKRLVELSCRPLVYGTTPEFLRCFGVESLDELPELPKNEPLAEENHEESKKVDNSDINSLE